jgi:hypothetical protein
VLHYAALFIFAAHKWCFGIKMLRKGAFLAGLIIHFLLLAPVNQTDFSETTVL